MVRDYTKRILVGDSPPGRWSRNGIYGFLKKGNLVLFLSVLLSGLLNAQTFDYGSGSVSGNNGTFMSAGNVSVSGNSVTVTGNVSMPTGTYEFENFTINAGVTVTVTGTGAPLIIRCTGTFTNNGILSANGGNGVNGGSSGQKDGGVGVAGGANGGKGGGPSTSSQRAEAGVSFGSSSGGGKQPCGAGVNTNGQYGAAPGGGAGYGVAGSLGGTEYSGNIGSGCGTRGAVGTVYGDATLTSQVGATSPFKSEGLMMASDRWLLGGSGGGGGGGSAGGGDGGGGGSGGAGGGAIQVVADNIFCGTAGVIRARGGNGGTGYAGFYGAGAGGGGGSGGTIHLVYLSSYTNNNSNVSARLDISGGNGGSAAYSDIMGNGGKGGNGGAGRLLVEEDELAGPTIDSQPMSAVGACTIGTTVIYVEASNATTYRWQVSTNGGAGWSNLSNNNKYSGVQTSVLSITTPPASYTGYKYRVVVSDASDNEVISDEATLTVQVCPANDHPTSGSGLLTSTNYVYPNCFLINGTTVNATINPATGEKDVWYRFEAYSNGVSMKVSSTSMDAKVYLFDSADLSTPLKVVDQIQGGGTEILNYDGLTAGHLYRIAVTPADGVEGDFTICLQQLRLPICDKTGTMGLCDLFKIKATGATTINVSFTDDNENTVSTTTSTFVTLSQESLGLKPEWNYAVAMVANYNALVDGLGNPEPIQVSNPDACSITIAPHALVEVKANQRCETLAVLSRNSYLNASVIGASSVCGANGYKIEFVEMDGCSGQSIALPMEKVILGTALQVHLTYPFPNAEYNSVTEVGYWKVRWKPRFANGYYGTYGPEHVIAINGTASAAAAMTLDPSEASNGLTTGENIAANIYPNPNNGDMVNINVTGVNGNDVYVRIMDAMGREVYSNRFEAEGSLNTIVSFSKPLASGLYMVEFRNGDNIITQRMMVSK